MVKRNRSPREEIRNYLISAIDKHPRDLVGIAADYFKISGQAIRNHINELIDKEIVTVSGKKKGIRYALKIHEKTFSCLVTRDLDESAVWARDVQPFIPKLKENALFICNYGFTEMLNNIKDHSGSSDAYIWIAYDALGIQFGLFDHGIGIFNKIQKDFHLENKSDAILELAKGKLTSDPEHHSGEGIFFTSRLVNDFAILSDDLYFYGHDDNDWLIPLERHGNGTAVFMKIDIESKLDPNEVFNKFASPEIDDYGFAKTHFPVKLLQHEGEALVSRSQAKRLVLRFGQFREVILDFEGVTRIGQGFADEIFRVFKQKNPQVHLTPINLSEHVEQTIKHVLSHSLIPNTEPTELSEKREE